MFAIITPALIIGAVAERMKFAAVLVFVAPRAHKYAVIGDVGVHEKCGEEFWKKLVHDMRAHFKNQDFNRAIILAISEIGKLLATHFPRTGDTINELPDEIAQG